MTRESLPLSGVYGLLEPGAVVLVTTAGRERPTIPQERGSVFRPGRNQDVENRRTRACQGCGFFCFFLF